MISHSLLMLLMTNSPFTSGPQKKKRFVKIFLFLNLTFEILFQNSEQNIRCYNVIFLQVVSVLF